MSNIFVISNSIRGIRYGGAQLFNIGFDLSKISHRAYCINVITVKQNVENGDIHNCFNKSLFPREALASGFSAINLTQSRSYMRKKTTKIPPTKPLHFDYSGDIVKTLDKLNLEEPKPGYEDVKQLSDDELLKRMFSLEFADGQTRLEKHLDIIREETQEHEVDKSPEIRIAEDTVKIRNQMQHVLAFRKDKKSKALLVKRIWQRYKFLRILQERDIEKFNWLTTKLQIKFEKLPEHNQKESRRSQRIKDARNKMLDVKNEKMKHFKERLEVERKAFEIHKKQELEEIEAQLKTFGVEKLESVEQVCTDLELGEPWVKPKEIKKSRRRRILEMKFALFATLPKYQRKW